MHICSRLVRFYMGNQNWHYILKGLRQYFFTWLILFFSRDCQGQSKLVYVDSGWANNSVNTVIFRKNSLVSYYDTQFVAFYNQQRCVVLGKRKLGESKWQLQQTTYQGNTGDAHNSISIMVDGHGYLHVAWDHHNHQLRYAKSISPGSLMLTDKMPMTGNNEQNVSYPEFYKLNDQKLLFFYRDGRSGQGNVVINEYDVATKKWSQLHSNLINGEGKRNAYWQACTDINGTIHISWTWRESPDVASNHDVAYACSRDGGKTWQKTNGDKYNLPVTEATAEYAVHIPQNSDLINQTSMCANDEGDPFIATYWRDGGTLVPQYHLVYHDKNGWQTLNLGFRRIAFGLSGGGTRKIPISRPQILVTGRGEKTSAVLIFRDEERGNKPPVAIIKKLKKKKWNIVDLAEIDLGSWEPTYDTELWKEKGLIHLFVQRVIQMDSEGKATIPPQSVQVLEWKPDF